MGKEASVACESVRRGRLLPPAWGIAVGTGAAGAPEPLQGWPSPACGASGLAQTALVVLAVQNIFPKAFPAQFPVDIWEHGQPCQSTDQALKPEGITAL